MFQLIDQTIRRAFSDAAPRYDILNTLHREIGRELLKKTVTSVDADTILDSGMGTGWLTRKVKFYYPDSEVVGLDIADGMVEEARRTRDGYHVTQGRFEELPFRDGAFDLILSNLACQWARPLSRAFAEAHRALGDGGALRMTLFGRETFRELYECLEELFDEDVRTRRSVHPMPSEQEVRQAASDAGFHNVGIETERIILHFADLKDLLRWIRRIGAKASSGPRLIGPRAYRLLDNLYEERFRERWGVRATYEVIWVKGTKQDD